MKRCYAQRETQGVFMDSRLVGAFCAGVSADPGTDLEEK